DYFLYDWHKLPKFSFHGYTHAKKAMENASKDYDLNEKEKNIIYSHMFPLNLFHFPKCKEAWIVLWQDKICAIKETVNER
ncbi:MAG: HD family phosphohydrolase, partial [Clostridia bacterium]|nr:HD family phosphohydrolase [Clostridia bacterium]